VDVLANYAEELKAAGGRLYLSGIDQHAREQVARTGKLDFSGPVRLYEATPVLGESTRAALADAEGWLAARQESG
jgi:SulP family sulfate permease